MKTKISIFLVFCYFGSSKHLMDWNHEVSCLKINLEEEFNRLFKFFMRFKKLIFYLEIPILASIFRVYGCINS